MPRSQGSFEPPGTPPGSPRCGRLSLETLRKLERTAQRAFAKGSYDDATHHTTRCVKALQAELASLLSLRAAIQLQQREYAGAAADAENAIQLNKQWYKGYLRKGAVLLAMNEPMEAAEQLETSLQLAPQNAEVKRTLREAYKSIANNCYEQGYYEFTIRWCDHAMEILRSEETLAEEEFSQQMAFCYASRSSANLRQGNPRESLKDAELAVFYNPWWVKGWLRKGTALALLGTSADADAAVDALEEGAMLDPRSKEVRVALAEARHQDEPVPEPFDAALSDVVGVDRRPADSRPEDVPLFHEEWARYHTERSGFRPDTLEMGVGILYDSYLQARNIKLHLFSLETYDWEREVDAVWHRVGCSERGVEWFRSQPRLGDVRDRETETQLAPLSNVRNRSYLHYPPMRLTIQVHRTVTLAMFNFVDLMVPVLSTVVYADSASVLEIIGYESNTYAIAKSAVLLQLLAMDAPLECVVQVWLSSGWSYETEAVFRQACVKLARQDNSGAAGLGGGGGGGGGGGVGCGSIPYEAKVIVQIWGGADSIPRQTSLRKWREGHTKQDLGFLAANLKHCQDRIDYCQYFLSGELLQCDVGSITMYAQFSEVQSVATAESLMQAVPLLQLHTAYHREGTLITTIVELFRRRLHLMRLRLRKRRLKVQFRLSPLPANLQRITLADPALRKELHEVRKLGATHFHWGTLPDRVGGSGMAELVELCGATHCKNYAQSLQWTAATFGTHLLDYTKEARADLIESLWREAQHSVRATGGGYMTDKPFAHPFHLCGWGLGKRYHKAWAQSFFLHCPRAVIHDVNVPDFCAFSLCPVSVTWTPEPLEGGRVAPGAVRSASPHLALQPADLGSPFGKPVHATTIQCHSCDEVVRLVEDGDEGNGDGDARAEAAPASKRLGRGHLAAERLDVIMGVFDDGTGGDDSELG